MWCFFDALVLILHTKFVPYSTIKRCCFCSNLWNFDAKLASFLILWDEHIKSYFFETSFKMKHIFYSVHTTYIYRYFIISTETKIIQKRMANLIGKSTKIKTVKHKTHTKTKPNKQIKHKQKKDKWALINTQKPCFFVTFAYQNLPAV